MRWPCCSLFICFCIRRISWIFVNFCRNVNCVWVDFLFYTGYAHWRPPIFWTLLSEEKGLKTSILASQLQPNPEEQRWALRWFWWNGCTWYCKITWCTLPKTRFFFPNTIITKSSTSTQNCIITMKNENLKSLKNGPKTAETRVCLKNVVFIQWLSSEWMGHHLVMQYPVLLIHLWLYGATIFASQCNVCKGVSML